MKKIWIFFLMIVVLSSMNFNGKDKTKLIAKKWVMTGMEVEGNTYGEEDMERQRRKGLVTILQFTSKGSCYVHIRTPKGKTTKRNRWKFTEDQTQIIIQAENSKSSQLFTIEKISGKKLILSLKDKENNSKQIFVYKAIK